MSRMVVQRGWSESVAPSLGDHEVLPWCVKITTRDLGHASFSEERRAEQGRIVRVIHRSRTSAHRIEYIVD